MKIPKYLNCHTISYNKTRNQKLQDKHNYIEQSDVIKCFFFETYGVQSSFSSLASRLLIKFDILGFIKLLHLFLSFDIQDCYIFCLYDINNTDHVYSSWYNWKWLNFHIYRDHNTPLIIYNTIAILGATCANKDQQRQIACIYTINIFFSFFAPNVVFVYSILHDKTRKRGTVDTKKKQQKRQSSITLHHRSKRRNIILLQ